MGKNNEASKKPKVEVKEELADAIVDGAECLNIRKEPEVKPNNQIAILGRGTRVVVVDPKKTEKNKDGEWYRIRIVDKESLDSEKDPTKNGFAMKKYIKII